ncbi:MAG: hypothetical protein JWO67_3182 [Streptosporangiaceae bacterium]|nr:hypothetical protein [Streptosporangiaceae bacterium]
MSNMMVPPQFVDGSIVRQADLNTLSTDVDTLCQLTTGKTAASGVSLKPAVRVTLSSAQSIANQAGGTLEIVKWGTRVYDSDSMWSSFAPDHIVINTPGWYRVMAHVWWDSATGANTTSERIVQLFLNGILDWANVTASSSENITGSGAFIQTVTGIEHLGAGAALYVGVWQTSGAALNMLTNGTWGTSLTAVWEAPY